MSANKRESSHWEPEFVIDVTETDEALGHGSYCVTVKVKYGHTVCAAKRLHDVLLTSWDKDEESGPEAKFREYCQLVSTLHHPNIVQFIGIAYLRNSKSPSVVLELLDTDFRKFLERQRSTIPLWIKHSILLDVAHGIEYLHSRSPCVINRDISSSCILLDKNLVAKIGDFVNARPIPSAKAARRMSVCPGNINYAALETKQRHTNQLAIYSSSIDIFSFGCLALEAIIEAFPDFNKRHEHIEILRKALVSSDPLFILIMSCLEDRPERRPTAAEVCDQLEKYGESVPGDNRSKLEMILKPETPAAASGGGKKQVSEDLVQQLLLEQTKLQDQVRSKEQDNQAQNTEIARLKQRIDSLQQETSDRHLQQQLSDNRQLQQQLTRVTTEYRQLQQELTRCISDKRQLEQQIAQSNASRGQLEQQIVGLRRLLSAQSSRSEDVEFWQVPREEVTIHLDQELGHGGWGVVVRGRFRGKEVAVKCIHQENLAYQRGMLLERFRREIRMMAKLRHPNLVLFMAAVLDDFNDPPVMIVTEILETTLRKIVEKNRVGKNKLSIFREVASALLYLHQHKEAIIHRDVSTANVLVCASANGTWTAKLSDFGSANLAQIATTLGDGALVYTAPEAYPQPTHPHSPPPPPQTTKIDVYSFGVLACEVITRVFPDPRRLAETVRSINRVWPEMYPMVSSCVEYRPESRPTMGEVLTRLNELDREP